MLKVKIGLGIIVLFAGSMFYLYTKGYKRNLGYRFKGEVRNIQYDSKGFPNVTINDSTYYLSYNNWNFNHKIQKSDTLEKEANTFTIKLTKYKSGDVFIFK